MKLSSRHREGSISDEACPPYCVLAGRRAI